MTFNLYSDIIEIRCYFYRFNLKSFVIMSNSKTKGNEKMKIRDTYILRSVAGENLVVAVGANVNFNSVMTLNETGKFLWEKLTYLILK